MMRILRCRVRKAAKRLPSLAVVLIALFAACEAYSAAPNADGVWDAFSGYWTQTLFPNLKLNYTTANYLLSQQPATVQYVSSFGKVPSNYSVNFALTSMNVLPVTLPKPWLNTLGPSVEYHKSNSSQPQDNLKAGIVGTSLFVWNEAPNKIGFYSQYDLAYVHDSISNRNDALFSSVDITPYFPKWGCSQEFDLAIPHSLAFMWIPDFGIQYESGNSVQGTGRFGAEGRFKASGELDVYPFQNDWKYSVMLYAIGTHWTALGATGEYAAIERNMNLFKAGVRYYFLNSSPSGKQNQQISLGLEFSDGENPETGQAYQRTLTLSFQAHL